jgi:sporulation protein YlmC with PRC-barrel domain
MSETDQIGHIGMIALGRSGLELAYPDDDVRGLGVLDPHGHRVGEVDEIVVDEDERRARLLVVKSGGILGLGEERRLVPVEAVTAVDEVVRVESTDDHVRSSGAYDPALSDRPDYSEVYGYYGFTPFWHAAYIPPYFHRRH